MLSADTDYRDFADDLRSRAIAASPESDVPLNAMLELTRLCSLKCTHCYIGDARWERDPAELSTREVFELLDAMAARGTIWLCLTGGEAMIRRDFREIWQHAKKKGFILTLFSNATLVDDAMAGFLHEHPPFVIEVSIYGASEGTYEAVTGVKGSYRRFRDGIDRIRAYGLPWKLKTVVLKENAHELEAMRALAQDWGVSFKYDGNINPSIGSGRTGGLAPCASRAESDELVALDLEGTDRETLARECAPPAGTARSEKLFTCGAGLNSVYVTAAGALQMCVLTGHRGRSVRAAGSVAEGFDEGFDGFAAARDLKRRADSPCAQCDLAPICDNCPGFAQLESGDEHDAVAWLCRKTHLKSVALGLPHKCDIRHYVYEKETR